MLIGISSVCIGDSGMDIFMLSAAISVVLNAPALLRVV